MPSAADILIRFGERLREKRTELGLSQEAFGDKCGLDRTYISGIERGKRNVSLKNVEAIATGLGITVGKLLSGL